MDDKLSLFRQQVGEALWLAAALLGPSHVTVLCIFVCCPPSLIGWCAHSLSLHNQEEEFQV